tara:strand:+ start:486 stop:866 length:381 start_codon:yes stop_codon:yes gene_type:complete
MNDCTEDRLWLIALGAAIADTDFRDELIAKVGNGARNPKTKGMLDALASSNVTAAHDWATRLGFPVHEGERCLPQLIESLRTRAVSRRLTHIATSLDYCARLTPEDFAEMLRGYMKELDDVGAEAP